MDVEALLNHLQVYGQSHLLQFWDELEPHHQTELYNDLTRLNIPKVLTYFHNAMKVNTSEKLDSRMEPIPEEQYSSVSNSQQIQEYRDIGLRCLREGKVGK